MTIAARKAARDRVQARLRARLRRLRKRNDARREAELDRALRVIYMEPGAYLGVTGSGVHVFAVRRPG